MNIDNQSQRGAAHLALVVAFVIGLIGILGFLGYNAWQKQSANAGSQNSLAREPHTNPYITCRVVSKKVRSDRLYDYYTGKAIFKNEGNGTAQASDGQLYAYWNYSYENNATKTKKVFIHPVPRLGPGKSITRSVTFKNLKSANRPPGDAGWVYKYGNYPNTKHWCD